MARTDNLSNYLTDVATAIKNKKGDQTPINASDFDTEITNLPSGGGVDPINLITDAGVSLKLSKYRTTLTQAQIELITPYTEILKEIIIPLSAFQNCSNITDLSGLKNCKIETATNGACNTFYGCKNLKILPTVDFSLANSLGQIFGGCSFLQNPPSNYFDTLPSYVGHDLSNTFYGCESLTDLSCIANIKPSTLNRTFYDCRSLVTIPQLNLALLGTQSAQISTSLSQSVSNCFSLSEQSLHNLIKSLTTVPSSYTSTKTLKYFGMTQEQATTCTTFDEWATLEANGWTTGY